MKINELFDLKDQVAVVTGGSGYLGKFISEALAEAGANVFITSRDKNKSKKTAIDLQHKTSGQITGKTLDILDEQSIANCFDDIVSKTGGIDILINNAAHISTGTLESISNDDWIRGIDGTINGVFRCTKKVIPLMENSKNPSIINISSIYGVLSPDPSIYENSGYDNPPHYGSGKSAIIQFTRYAACHLANKGIRVNSISPGAFPKNEVQKNEDFIANLKRKIPLNRIGHPSELKGVIVFLSSKASSYITGQNIHVDGGWSAW
jgi:gluconate 5-dehydrogenase